MYVEGSGAKENREVIRVSAPKALGSGSFILLCQDFTGSCLSTLHPIILDKV